MSEKFPHCHTNKDRLASRTLRRGGIPIVGCLPILGEREFLSAKEITERRRRK
jgi:hypothetical protein